MCGIFGINKQMNGDTSHELHFYNYTHPHYIYVCILYNTCISQTIVKKWAKRTRKKIANHMKHFMQIAAQ